jgi:hypothetical protein
VTATTSPACATKSNGAESALILTPEIFRTASPRSDARRPWDRPTRRPNRVGEIDRLRVLSDDPSIAQDDHAVGNRFEVAELVRDIKNGDAALPQVFDHGKQALRFWSRQTCSRLVEDKDRGIARHCCGNRDQLPLGDRECSELTSQVDIEANALSDLPRHPTLFLCSREKQLVISAVAVEQKIVGD